MALLLSLLFPGWGQIYNGQLRKALVIWCGWLIVHFCAVSAGLLETPSGFLKLLYANIGIDLVIALEAALSARRLALEPRQFTSSRWYAYLSFAVIVCVLSLSESLVLRRFFFQAYKIPSGAMEPTLLIGDDILVNKRLRNPQRGDVIVFIFPADRTKEFVKRVVAVGGDSIEIRNGATSLNGQPMTEAHARFEIASGDRSATSPRDNFGPVTVPAGKLFVMGDNRDRSYDSRFWGFVDQTDVEGRVLYVYWSRDLENGSSRVRW
jgi:signal peptidase I